MGSCTIYCLKDPITGAVRYVGKANDLQARIRSHRWEKWNLKLQNRKVHWLRSLTQEPLVEILEVVNKDVWADRERYWIKRFRDQGADLTNFADGGQTSPVEGKGHTAETKAKLRAAAIRRGAVPPSRAGSVPWNKGTKGAVRPNAGTFQKGQLAWNKGQKQSQCKRGHALPENAYYRDGRYRYCKRCQGHAIG